MGKGVALKDAVKEWGVKNGVNPGEATLVKLHGWIPPIEKLDPSLGSLLNCEKLSLSTNMIEKLTNLNSLPKLRVISLARNKLKSFNGIEPLGDTLEELWASYNHVEKLKSLSSLKNLKVLYMSNNKIKDIMELKNLADLPNLEELILKNCPVEEILGDTYRAKVAELLPQVKKLDGKPLLTE